jgi:hypothetical protein
MVCYRSSLSHGYGGGSEEDPQPCLVATGRRGEEKQQQPTEEEQEEIQRNQTKGGETAVTSLCLCGGKGIQHQGHIFHSIAFPLAGSSPPPTPFYFIFSILHSLLDMYVCFTPHTYTTIK